MSISSAGRASLHPSYDELADVSAGLVDAARSHEVEAHLLTCAACVQANAEIAAVSAFLATQPVPAMPELVQFRIQRALADEVLLRADRAASDDRAPTDAPPVPAAFAKSFDQTAVSVTSASENDETPS